MILSWNTTNKCNLKCKHCYRESGERLNGELSTKEGKELIDDICKAGFKIMIFSGGEPLMRNDIFQLINYAKNKGLRPVLGSNGTLITKEVAIKLKEAGVMAIGISLDSLNAKLHNKFRGCDNAFKDAILGMKNCRDVGLDFQIHTTIMNWNKEEIMYITDFSVAMGAIAHHIFFLVPTGRGKNIEKELLDKIEYRRLLTDIMKKQKEVSIQIKPTCAPQFIKVAESIGINSRFKKGCIAGTNYCIISPKGDVQPCAYLNEIAGNIRDIPFDYIWKNSTIFKELRTLKYEGNCGKCDFKIKCGGCRARAAFYNNGNYMAGDNSCFYYCK
ncbi:putative heme d1 biosynthesis radical SAM protein NirJ2 [Clostridium rectalis]|uniref:putative heme d1 biosynthesis radical SAM protein NirJ2 n=1 Tax=Clostridium rectalis TaxID=2040295 RepID=UPI000F63E7ED|nr:putative heme d1 biosynthesis radical SAM protein NirJ2 [Clostridium rectalis]